MAITLNEELAIARKKTVKPMLLISMASMFMIFAGLLSAYVISSTREDWVSFELPTDFTISTVVIILSSVTLWQAKAAVKKDLHKRATYLLWAALLLGLFFTVSQYWAFQTFQSMGLFFTGTQSEVSSSMLMIIVLTHFLHLFAGLISLMVVIYNHFRLKYTPSSLLGLELACIFWHFLDLLWCCLFFFFLFIT